MFRKNKLTNKKENHNQININTSNETNIFIKIYEELKSINKSLVEQFIWIKDHEHRIKKLEKSKKGGRG